MSDVREELALKVASEMSSWSSVDISLEQGITIHRDVRKGPRRPTASKSVYHYIETSTGQRMADIQLFLSGTDSIATHFVGYCDSRRCASVDVDGMVKQRRIHVSKSFMSEAVRGDTERPDPFRYFYVGKTPLYEALPGAEYVGTGQVLHRPVEVFRFRRVRFGMVEQTMVYCLDAETGVPVKVEGFDPASGAGENNCEWRWEALSLDGVGRFHFPLRSQSDKFITGASEGVMKVATYVNICQVKYDQKFGKETFWPVFQPGVLVTDLLVNKSYRVPGAHWDQASSNLGDASKEALRATRPDGFYPAASLTGILLGSASVFAGIFLWAKRR